MVKKDDEHQERLVARINILIKFDSDGLLSIKGRGELMTLLKEYFLSNTMKLGD